MRPRTLAIGILRTKFLKNLSRFSAESVNRIANASKDSQLAREVQAILAEQPDVVKPGVWRILTADERTAFKALLQPGPEQPMEREDAAQSPPPKATKSKKPFKVGERVVVAYSDVSFYRGVKGEIVEIRSTSVPHQQKVTVRFDKPVKLIERGTFLDSELMRLPS